MPITYCKNKKIIVNKILYFLIYIIIFFNFCRFEFYKNNYEKG